MAKLSSAKLDMSKATEGEWEDYPIPGLDGEKFRFKLGYVGSQIYRKELRKEIRKYRNQYKTIETIPDDVMDNIYKSVFSRAIVFDWDLIEDDDGNPIPFSSERILEVFNDPDHQSIWDFIFMRGQDAGRFRIKEREDAEKN